jgi:prepilin peptidase CpaA
VPEVARDIAIALEFGFAVAMLASAGCDLAWRRLPNWLNAAVAIGYLPWAWATGASWETVATALAVGGAVLAIGFGLFAAGVIGGGDAKLAAAVAIWIAGATGFSLELLRFALVMSLAGGVLAVVALAWQIASKKRLQRPLPYGVAIAAAGLDFLLRHGQASCLMDLC